MLAEFLKAAGFRLVATEALGAVAAEPLRVVHPDPGLRMTLAPAAPMPPGWYTFELVFPAEGLVDVVVEFTFAGGAVLWLRLPVIARNHFLAHFRLEREPQQLTLILTGSGACDAPRACRFARIGIGGQVAAAARRGIEIFRRDGFGVVASGVNYLWRLTRPGSIAVSRGSAGVRGESPYQTWMRLFDEDPQRDAARHAQRLAALSRRPLLSVIATVTSAGSAARLAHAMAQQIYPDWEVVAATAAARCDEIAAAFSAAGLDIAKLRIVDAGARGVDGLNAALAVSQGAFVLPLAETTVLRPHALLELALTLERMPSASLVYADEDRIDATGARSDWRFKPAWSPAWFAATNYLGALTLLHRPTVWALGGWRAEAADPQHDLLSRVAAAQPHDIVHLAKVLVHVTPDDTPRITAPAPRPIEAPRLIEAPRPIEAPPRVSIIIPTRDGAEILSSCIRSIRARTRYPDYEIIIVDNGSVEDATERLFAELGADPAIRVMPRPEPFNFSSLNNAAAREATGTVLAFVNNDIEVTHDDWLDAMVALALRPESGCVGAKLLYPDGRLQHAGVVIGLGGVAGHAYRFAPADAPGYLGQLRATHEVSAVTAACLVIRRSVFDAVGGFDEELAVAFNDVDLCLKVRAAGYRNLWTPSATLIHHESVSRGRDLTPTKAKRFAEEYATMQRRWGAALLGDPYYSPHLTYDREDFSLRLR